MLNISFDKMFNAFLTARSETRIFTQQPIVKINISTKNSIHAAHKKGAGSTKNGRDSISKRHGVKIYGNQLIMAGDIIIRQVGNNFYPGANVECGKNYTIFALTDGTVKFECIRSRDCISIVSISQVKKTKLRLFYCVLVGETMYKSKIEKHSVIKIKKKSRRVINLCTGDHSRSD